MKTVAAQVAPPLVNNKRHRDAYGETPKKRLRSSLEEDSQARYTIASDIFGLQVQELLGNLEAETNTNLRMVTGLLTQVKEAIEDLPSQKPLLASFTLFEKIQTLIMIG